MPNDPRGSNWRRWDLHVHTPLSLRHNYGGGADVWERFIQALENLPDEFAVIGINDYLFLDGYRKVVEFKNQGRLPNIDTILPVLEFRIDKFAGTDGRLRRINYHAIFSESLTSDQIEHQFLGQLRAHYVLSPDAGHEWSGVLTRKSLSDLGSKIIESVPDDKKGDFGSPLIEGFNNLNLPKERFQEALRSPYFRNNVISAVGKTEWADLKWNDQSIAEKKTLINEAQVVFTASESASEYARARDSLAANGVNSRLLDCSDAHNWSESGDKDSIGRCELWVKADTTFQGLQHAILEFDERVFVGTTPPKLADVRRRPQKYIDSIAVEKRPGSTLTEEWFDVDIPLNTGLVAIIGNKGSGKSALADIVALGANSQQSDNFSFLNASKFKHPAEKKADHFEARLRWCSGDSREFVLSDEPDIEDVERVRYIPQSFLERLCNELTLGGGSAFDSELRSVIFSHIPTAERLGKPSLDSLLAYLGEETHDRIGTLKSDLAKINRDIATLEKDASPEHKREAEKRLTARLKEITALKAARPAEVSQPEADPETRKAVEALQSKISSQRTAIEKLETQVASAIARRKLLLAKIATADKLLQRLRNLNESYQSLAQESEADLEQLGLAWNDIVQLTLNTEVLRDLHDSLVSEEAEIQANLAEDNPKSDAFKLVFAKEELAKVQNQLDAPTRRYHEYLSALAEWKESIEQIEADPDDPESVLNLRGELDRLSKLPAEIVAREAERMDICREVHSKMSDLKEHYRRLYRPVQEFIQGHQSLAESIQLSFDVQITGKAVVENILEWINRGRSGSFQGAEDGAARLKDLVDRSVFDTQEGVESFLTELMQALHSDLRQEKPKPLSVSSQLRSGRSVSEFYDYLFGLGYLEPRYSLKMEGKQLSELSPGERGLLLLLFYLLVEKNDGPLILDQPEENLDNETVHEVLVPSLQLAKQRRQIIIVTHNPNLAVVADADQLVASRIDKKNLCRATYESGALENPQLNRHVVTYLEGTLPAFMNRDSKYMRPD